MKKMILLLMLPLLLIVSCEKDKTEPTESNLTKYTLKNTSDKTLSYKFYDAIGGYYNDTGIVMMGSLAPNESKSFDISDFSRNKKEGWSTAYNNVYYIDWYSLDDMLVSADLHKDNSRIGIYENKSDTTIEVGNNTQNYVRKILLGTNVSAKWYDQSFPSDKTYTISRGAIASGNGTNITFVYQESGAEYYTDSWWNGGTDGTGKKYYTIRFQVRNNEKPAANITLGNGEKYGTVLGGVVMKEIGGSGRTFKRN